MSSEPHTTMAEQIQDLTPRVQRLAMIARETSEASGTSAADELVGLPWITVPSLGSYIILNDL